MLELVLNFLFNLKKENIKFPQSCIICGKMSKEYVCTNCENRFDKYKKFNIIDNEKLTLDKIGIQNIKLKQKYYLVNNEKIYWEKLIYCFEYKSIVRKYILQYKFFDKSYLANFFCYEMLRNKKIYEILKNYDLIIPVPMGKIKKSRRGYNQTELIVNIISKKCKIISDNNVLEKVKSTKTQSTLKRNDRKNNVENSYVVKCVDKVKNKKIVLFDDIYTTGATVNEISKKLKQAGVRKILIIVIAKD